MNEHSTILLLGLHHEVDGFIESALNVLADMILQVPRQILNSIVDVIVITVVSCAVDDVSNTVLSELFQISSNDVTTKIQEVIEYH